LVLPHHTCTADLDRDAKGDASAMVYKAFTLSFVHANTV
jgi:hypothetical protein